MKILIEATGLIPIYPEVLSVRPLGGTETAVVKIAEELAKLGLDITIRTAHEQSSGEKPHYLSFKENVDFSAFDAVIIVQNLKAIPFMPMPVKVYFWTGDGSEQFSNFGLGDLRIVNRLTKLITTTDFHKSSLCKASGYPMEKAVVIGNGVGEMFFEKKDSNREGLIYHSAPYRGLTYLLQYFTELRKDLDKISLNIYSDMELYGRRGKYEGPHSEVLPSLIKNYSQIQGINFMGTVPQKDLAVKLKRANIFPYPCTVPEVFCMSMLEAMAAGVVPLVSDIGGLAEVLGDSDLVVEGVPGNKIFDNEFLSRLKKLYLDFDFIKEKRKILTKRASSNFLWESQARRFYEVLKDEK
jgi:glycosyltransferase involved in cell wall biosynthesis